MTAFEAPGRCVTGAAFGDGVLYVADRQADVVHVLDPGSGEVVRELPVPGYVPLGLAHDGSRPGRRSMTAPERPAVDGY